MAGSNIVFVHSWSLSALQSDHRFARCGVSLAVSKVQRLDAWRGGLEGTERHDVFRVEDPSVVDVLLLAAWDSFAATLTVWEARRFVAVASAPKNFPVEPTSELPGHPSRAPKARLGRPCKW